ncbi:MAG: 3-hydroxyacyl-CoA dehydrogenase [Burkholderiaceae bacterium]|nr:3-hydroxyacyl-CoA dehydrogenase [Burkholderiaceae bacterium]
MEKIAVIGTGLVGRSWSIVFARAGREVALYDADAAAAGRARSAIAQSLSALRSAGLVADIDAIQARIRPAKSLAEALDGAVHAQEAVTERVEVKREVFRDMDSLAAPETVLASSSSTLPASAFASELAGKRRCLVAHPLNPPHLVPLVELVPAPWTDPEVVRRTKALMASVGQEPITMLKEVPGFIVNRLQVALLNEAFALVEDGCITPEDLDKSITHGLGLRWSVVGPFETIDLNAARGVKHYVEIFGAKFFELLKPRGAPRPWAEQVVQEIDQARRAVLPLAEIPSRQAWRDERLTELAALRAGSSKE